MTGFFVPAMDLKDITRVLIRVLKRHGRHAEPKADRIIPLGRHKNESFDDAYGFAKMFYDLNNLNQTSGGGYHIRRIKEFINTEMDVYYESSEMPKPDTSDFYDAIDDVLDFVDKQRKRKLKQDY